MKKPALPISINPSIPSIAQVQKQWDLPSKFLHMKRSDRINQIVRNLDPKRDRSVDDVDLYKDIDMFDHEQQF